MTQRELVSLVAKREGKKHQASIGDVREIIRILADVCDEDPQAMVVFVKMVTDKKRKKK